MNIDSKINNEMKKYFIIFFLPCLIVAQVKNRGFKDVLMEITDNYEQAKERIIDELIRLHENPININFVSYSYLASLPFLSEAEAKKIVLLRNKLGRITSFKQLKEAGISSSAVKYLRYFVFVARSKSNQTANGLNINFRSRTLIKLPESKGFAQGKYAGGPFLTYFKLKSSYNKNLIFNALVEKDPGERKLNDFQSFFLMKKNIAGKINLILGDYQIEFGQGLVFWSPYSFGKTASATEGVVKNAAGAYGSESAAEYHYFRGLALNVNLKKFNVLFFYSMRSFDAHPDSALNIFTSIGKTGFHRTTSERRNKNRLKSASYGAFLKYSFGSFNSLALALALQKFNHKIIPASLMLPIEKNICFSSSFNLLFGNIFLSGEVAYSNKKIAFLTSISSRLTNGVKIVALLRRYPFDYFSFWNGGFGESSINRNEEGFYLGLKLNPSFAQINFYYDIFRFPHFSSLNIFPSAGNELSIEVKPKIVRFIELSLRYFEKNKEKSETISDKKKLIVVKLKRLRINLKFGRKPLKFQSRLDFSTVEDHGIKKGMLFLQDVNFYPLTNLAVYFRVAWFSTDSFENALYEYEKDVYGAFSLPSLYGKGLRWYFLISYDFLKNFYLDFKISETYKPQEREIGSGWEERQSNYLRTFGLSFRILF